MSLNSNNLFQMPLPNVDRGDGKFEYIKDIHYREMLINAFRAITVTETWDYVGKDPGPNGFTFSVSSELSKIMEATEKCQPYVGHSGSSFGWTMRQMQYIANNGEAKHRENCKEL